MDVFPVTLTPLAVCFSLGTQHDGLTYCCSSSDHYPLCMFSALELSTMVRHMAVLLGSSMWWPLDQENWQTPTIRMHLNSLVVLLRTSDITYSILEGNQSSYLLFCINLKEFIFTWEIYVQLHLFSIVNWHWIKYVSGETSAMFSSLGSTLTIACSITMWEAMWLQTA